MQRFRNADPLPDPELPPVWASMSHSLEMGHRAERGKMRHIYESVKISKKAKICVDKRDRVCYHVENAEGHRDSTPNPFPFPGLTGMHLQNRIRHTGLPIEVHRGKPGQMKQGHDPHRQRDKGNTGRGGRH